MIKNLSNQSHRITRNIQTMCGQCNFPDDPIDTFEADEAIQSSLKTALHPIAIKYNREDIARNLKYFLKIYEHKETK